MPNILKRGHYPQLAGPEVSNDISNSVRTDPSHCPYPYCGNCCGASLMSYLKHLVLSTFHYPGTAVGIGHLFRRWFRRRETGGG